MLPYLETDSLNKIQIKNELRTVPNHHYGTKKKQKREIEQGYRHTGQVMMQSNLGKLLYKDRS